MCTIFRSAVGRLLSLSAFSLVTAALAAGPAWAQSEKKEPSSTTAKAPAKDAKDSAKDTAKAAKDSAKDMPKTTKNTAKDTAKDTAVRTNDRTKETAKDTTDAKDRGKDAATAAQDRTKDGARSRRDPARDTARETRDSVRDSARDTRREVRGVDRDAPELRDARNGGDVRDRRDVRADRDVRDDRELEVRDRSDVRDRTDIRDDRDARDARDRRDFRDERDVREFRDERVERDFRDTRDRDTVRDIDRRDFRSDVRTSRGPRDVSRTRIENFRAESVTARDLGVRFGQFSGRGLVIDDLSRTAVLAHIGLRRGDVIVSVDEHRVRSDRDFIHFLFDPDLRHEVVTIIVLRDGREVPIEVRPVTIIEELVMVHDDYDPLHHFGVVIDDRSPDEVVVVRVIPESPAFVAGVRPGDVITTFRGDRVRGPREFVQVLERVEPGQAPIVVNRDRRIREFTVDVPQMERRATGVRRSAARPDFDIDRPAIERREERRENRVERREERRDETAPAVVPAVPAQPATPAQPARPLLPRLLPGNR